jgi:hypothetical protein
MQQARHTTATPEAAAAAVAPPAAAAAPSQVVGTQEWVDEWAPQASQQQQQRQRRRQQGRAAGRGRGRGGSSRQQQNGDAHANGEGSSDGAAAAAAIGDVDVDSAAAAADVAAAARTTVGVYARLAPLPAGLAAAFWSDVVASSLPEGDESCCICTEDFTEELEGGGVRLVTQLQCRHTYCVLCLRQLATNRATRRQPLHCPQCRAEV